MDNAIIIWQSRCVFISQKESSGGIEETPPKATSDETVIVNTRSDDSLVHVSVVIQWRCVPGFDSPLHPSGASGPSEEACLRARLSSVRHGEPARILTRQRNARRRRTVYYAIDDRICRLARSRFRACTARQLLITRKGPFINYVRLKGGDEVQIFSFSCVEGEGFEKSYVIFEYTFKS